MKLDSSRAIEEIKRILVDPRALNHKELSILLFIAQQLIELKKKPTILLQVVPVGTRMRFLVYY